MSIGVTELIFGLISTLLVVGFWVIVIVLVVKILRRGGSPSVSSALVVLEERYARGEIDEQEFLERRAVLVGKG